MEKMKAINKEIEELWKKLSPLSDMDKKIRKLSQKLDLDQILKQLQGKADSSDMVKDLGLLEEKIKGSNELFNQLRREFEKIDAFYNEFSGMLHTNPQETVTSLGIIVSRNQDVSVVESKERTWIIVFMEWTMLYYLLRNSLEIFA